METIKIKANKTTLNKVIKWSSSKFNEYKKHEVVDIILKVYKENKNCEMTFGTGAFTERNCWGWRYHLVKEYGKTTLTTEFSNNNICYELI